MAKNYKVKAVSPGPKEWEGKFGPMLTYRMKLEEVDDVVEINKKPDSPAPKPGDELYGTLETNDYGTKFKAEKPAFAFGSTRGGFSRPDNSDGQRQGMWFNNAAAYVEKLSEMNGKVLKPTEWADTVHKYAQAGYQLGELTAQSGYEKAKATASTLKKDEVVEDLGEGMTEDNFELGDEPINLEDIPF